MLNLDHPARYCVRVQGRVSADWTDWLENIVVAFEGEGAAVVTCITGTVRDQAALFGLLSRVRDLGVPLISVEYAVEGKEQDERD